jgi:hypothetical protein
LTTAVFEWSGRRWDENGKLRYATRFHGFIADLWFDFAAFWHRFVHMATVRLIPMRRIGLPFDGAVFEDRTREACADRLQWLATLGYRVPADVIAALRRENR